MEEILYLEDTKAKQNILEGLDHQKVELQRILDAYSNIQKDLIPIKNINSLIDLINQGMDFVDVQLVKQMAERLDVSLVAAKEMVVPPNGYAELSSAIANYKRSVRNHGYAINFTVKGLSIEKNNKSIEAILKSYNRYTTDVEKAKVLQEYQSFINTKLKPYLDDLSYKGIQFPYLQKKGGANTYSLKLDLRVPLDPLLF